MTPITLSIKVGFNARLFPNDWRPAREEIAFAHAHGFSALQFRGLVTGLDATRLGDTFTAVAAALRAARLIAVMEIVVPVDRTGRTASGTTPLDALRANLPAITALPCAHVHIHAVPDEPMDDAALDIVEERVLPRFEAAVALAKEHEFRFGFEHNEPSIGLFGTPERCARALAAVPDLGFVWDCDYPADRSRSGAPGESGPPRVEYEQRAPQRAARDEAEERRRCC